MLKYLVISLSLILVNCTHSKSVERNTASTPYTDDCKRRYYFCRNINTDQRSDNKPISFCLLNNSLDEETLRRKLDFFESCNSRDGIVDTNKIWTDK